MVAVVWIVAGLVLSVLARAVAPRGQVVGVAASSALGIAGGLGGGFAIDRLARSTVAGFTAGLVGSILGACVLLIIGNVAAAPGDARA